MDPQYRKFMCDQPPSKCPTEDKLDKTQPETTDMPVSEGEGEIIIFIVLKNVILSKKVIHDFHKIDTVPKLSKWIFKILQSDYLMVFN